jgi:hypothetical protein
MQDESTQDRPKPTEDDELQKKESEKNLDRDGGERQPTDYSTEK